MLATESAVVERLNLAARATLIDRGEVSRRGRTYLSDDHTRDILSVGDWVRRGRNDGHMRQPDGARVQVRNGMDGAVVTVSRQGITVALDPVRSWSR
jgi:hypothetical protein